MKRTAHIYFDEVQGYLHVDFSRCFVRHVADVERIRDSLLNYLQVQQQKISAIVNYDGFTVRLDVLDAFADMVQEVAQKHYSSVCRYTKHPAVRSRLGRAFHQRGMAAHFFGSEPHAKSYLNNVQRSRCSRLKRDQHVYIHRYPSSVII